MVKKIETYPDKIETIKEQKRRCKRAAKELGYGDAVVEAISNAKSRLEIDMIMRDARRNKS